jgi:hypothetical protein
LFHPKLATLPFTSMKKYGVFLAAAALGALPLSAGAFGGHTGGGRPSVAPRVFNQPGFGHEFRGPERGGGPAFGQDGRSHGHVLDKLVLVSWLKDAGKDTILVENTDTNDVQQITSQPNKDHFRIVEMHVNADPRLTEVVISNGAEQGPVKFRFETPATGNPPARLAPLVSGVPGQTPAD